MKLQTPTFGPYSSAVFPAVERYDISSVEPADWHLTVRMETPITPFFLRSVCVGELSTVPPWELPYNGTAPLSPPDATLPAKLTLYLAPTMVGFVIPALFNLALDQARLGNRLLCFVYDNVDPASLGSEVIAAINSYAPLKKLFDSPKDRMSLFLKGEFAVPVALGAVVGRAMPTQGGHNMFQFGVMTSTGLVDPVQFFAATKAYAADQNEVTSFGALVGSDWPFDAQGFLAGPSLATVSSTLSATSTRLYPFPVLHEAKERLPLDAAAWQVVGNAQKKLYWQRLAARADNGTGAVFTFNTSDMANPFQLEAVSEFYMTWPEPTNTQTSPLPEPPVVTVPGDPSPVLQRPGWNIVVIDPFSDPVLGSPTLPRPDWRLKKYKRAGDKCSATTYEDSGGQFEADSYNAVLFLLRDGEVKGWFRWSTYSSHKWEDKAQKNCELSSSATGNVRYDFESLTAISKAFINYAFLIWSTASGQGTEGRRYFRTDLPIDQSGKTGVMIHYGQAINTASAAHKTLAYHGSAGCLVSPAFYAFRSLVIQIHRRALRDATGQWETELAPLEGLKHEQSVRKYGERGSGKADAVKASYWNHKIAGNCWLIRPDEATRK